MLVANAFCPHPSSGVLSPTCCQSVRLHMPYLRDVVDGEAVENYMAARVQGKITILDVVLVGEYVQYVHTPKGFFLTSTPPPTPQTMNCAALCGEHLVCEHAWQCGLTPQGVGLAGRGGCTEGGRDTVDART